MVPAGWLQLSPLARLLSLSSPVATRNRPRRASKSALMFRDTTCLSGQLCRMVFDEQKRFSRLAGKLR
uniref:Putative secreted protein n=1 Tax=Anopheles triannulatus TaxID=58253 RepID=A0A2M4B2V3_9DIPT